MPRVVWCRRCGHEVEVLAGNFPEQCEQCRKSARWTTVSPLESVPAPWELSVADRAWLRKLRIAAD